MAKKLSWIVSGIFLALFATGFIPPTKVEIVARKPSVYNGELMVLESAGSRYLIAKSNRGIVLQSHLALAEHDEIKAEYLQVMAMLTSMHPQPAQVFNLGLGGGALPRFHLARFPKSEVESAEIDPAVIDVARKYFFVNNPRHTVLTGEGFDVLRSRTKKFDVVWVDAITPKEGPKAYLRAEHIQALQDHLRPDGLVVANLGEARSVETIEELERSYRRSFKYGVRVRLPESARRQTLETLKALVATSDVALDQPVLPIYFVAVGNNPSVNCGSFLAAYGKVHELRSASRVSCADL